MRPSVFAVLTVASLGSCGGGMEAGAYLQVDKIPAGATDIEVVLAAAPRVIDGQRSGSGFTATTSVPYYVQRGSTGGFAPVAGKDSLLVQIKPSLAPNAATDVVPIVIARGVHGDDSTILAIAMLPVGSDASAASADAMMDLTVTSVAAVYEVSLVPMAASALVTATCPVTADNAVAHAGIAWPTTDGAQLRLLRLTDSAGDGSDLPLDFDCDTYTADMTDCDDLVSTTYDGASEICDGIDSDCRGDRVWAAACGPAGTGIACPTREICDELQPDTGSACEVAPTSGCGMGEYVCAIHHAHPDGGLTPACVPAIGQLTIPSDVCAGPCTVRVVHTSPDWNAQVAIEQQGLLQSFADRVETQNNRQFSLRVTPSGTGSDDPTLPSAALGVIDLFVSDGSGDGPETYFGVGLFPYGSAMQTDTCTPPTEQGPGIGSGDSEMNCFQTQD